MSRRHTSRFKQWRPGMRVFLYIRVSKIGDRADTLISDEVQEQACRSWAEREGLIVVGEPVTDLDKSGRDVSKRQISATIDRVRRGEADGIVVWKVSRWGRDFIDSMLNVGELQEAGGFIASATENLDDIESPMGRFSLTQMLAIAQLQSDQIGETWVNIQNFRRERGLPHNGSRRFGYVKNDDIGPADDPSLVYTIDPHTGPWLRQCYEDFVAGKTITKLVLELNANQVPTTRGGRFTSRTLRNLLDSGFGAGMIIDRRNVDLNADDQRGVEYHPGAHAPVIAADTWTAYLHRRAHKPAANKAAATTKLAGLLHCASCHRRLRIYWSSQGGTTTRFRGYECGRDKHSNQTTILCPAPVSIRQKVAEASMLTWIESNARGEGPAKDARKRQRQHQRALARADAIDHTVTKLEHRQDNLLDNLLDDAGDATEILQRFSSERTQLSKQITALTAQANQLREAHVVPHVPVEAEFEDLLGTWNEGTESATNRALQGLVSRIYVHRTDDKSDGLTGRLEIIGRWNIDPHQTASPTSSPVHPSSSMP